MHQWDDEGIIISVSRYGEQSAIVRALTAEHGLYAGMVKGVYSKKWRGVFQPGNLVHIHWQARLEEHLGMMRCELLRSVTAQLLAEPLALRFVNAAAAMVLTTVPERIEERDIYNKLIALISTINAMDDAEKSLECYVWFEYTLLHALGFGLDLSECAATASTIAEELVYVSPKSGRAVSAAAGEPYKTRMLPLPAFLRDGQTTRDMRQMLDALALTGYFLEAWLLQPEGKKLPAARQDLLDSLHRLLDK